MIIFSGLSENIFNLYSEKLCHIYKNEPKSIELHLRLVDIKSKSLQVFCERLSLWHPLQRRHAKQHRKQFSNFSSEISEGTSIRVNISAEGQVHSEPVHLEVQWAATSASDQHIQRHEPGVWGGASQAQEKDRGADWKQVCGRVPTQSVLGSNWLVKDDSYWSSGVHTCHSIKGAQIVLLRFENSERNSWAINFIQTQKIKRKRNCEIK